MNERLYRSRRERMIWGVCGGLGEYFAVDPVLVRIAFVALVFAGGVGILLYLIMAIIIPLEGTTKVGPREVLKENIENLAESAAEVGEQIRSSLKGEKRETPDDMLRRRRNLAGIILVVIGVILLIANFSWWLSWGKLWPVILIVIGAVIIWGAVRRK